MRCSLYQEFPDHRLPHASPRGNYGGRIGWSEGAEPARSKSAGALGRGVFVEGEGLDDGPGLVDRGRPVEAYLARVTATGRWGIG